MPVVFSATLVWMLMFEGHTTQLYMGEYSDRASCQKAGAWYKEHAEVLLETEHPGWVRPLHFGCWPVEKLTE